MRQALVSYLHTLFTPNRFRILLGVRLRRAPQVDGELLAISDVREAESSVTELLVRVADQGELIALLGELHGSGLPIRAVELLPREAPESRT